MQPCDAGFEGGGGGHRDDRQGDDVLSGESTGLGAKHRDRDGGPEYGGDDRRDQRHGVRLNRGSAGRANGIRMGVALGCGCGSSTSTALRAEYELECDGARSLASASLRRLLPGRRLKVKTWDFSPHRT